MISVNLFMRDTKSTIVKLGICSLADKKENIDRNPWSWNGRRKIRLASKYSELLMH